MSAFPLLDVQTTVERARALCARIDAAADPRRAVTDLSLSTVASMAILVGQLDAIAQAAAEAETALRPVMTNAPAEAALAAGRLAGRLRVAGYLPLPEQEEPAHGEG